MTSSQESSNDRAEAPSGDGLGHGIESLAGTFHPHAIEVQDFDFYGRVIDLRSRAEYEDDHIPGAVHVEPPADALLASAAALSGSGGIVPLSAGEPQPAVLWPALEAAVSGLGLDEAILVYCGKGGLVSTPAARALRWRGWSTDVLGGGWINYRRWVQAGLEVLPRMVAFRVVSCTLGSETARVLAALRDAGEQVLDVEGLASYRRFALGPAKPQQPQAWFESLLLRDLRGFDPRQPVWVGELVQPLGALSLPGALREKLARAPTAALQVPVSARVSAWQADERMCADPPALLVALRAVLPAPGGAVSKQWRSRVSRGDVQGLLESVLTEFLDLVANQERAARAAIPAPQQFVAVRSFEASDLAAAMVSLRTALASANGRSG